MVKSGIKCPRCGGVSMWWCSYFCPECGAHNDVLYRREHREPGLASHLDRAGIVAEYRRAGLPYQRLACLYDERGKESAA